MRRSDRQSPQRRRREEVEAAEAETRAQVFARDGNACIINGHTVRTTLQHILTRGAGGTSEAIDPRLGIVLCGSGTTGCHGLVEHEGRIDGWAYDLGYLAKHGRRVNAIRESDDATWLVWGHYDGHWWELFKSGVRAVCHDRPRPSRAVLLMLDQMTLS